ncbi:MAG: glycoside hydrolase family 43 protein [Henriciella sp.]|uniref:glycoside hydrolase family 43 protein n=1 Tax=Henriciella sp. TaxID=1968823 RepID=UPI003C75EA12
MASNEQASAPQASFSWFQYTGDDPAFSRPPGPDGYLNPVLAGFYPDPSITRGPDGYYLVHSTFSYFPGIPVFHSKDLVHWEQIGNVIDRPGMLDFDGLGLSRGVFAPTIEYHDGIFYVANTCVDCGGNFIVTATDPAGPWSDPVWLPDVGGIDPSLFFEEDGSVWIMNNDEPPGGSTYSGHRAIWFRQIDPETFQSISEPIVLIDGGVRPEDKPIWIEGPHIYHVDGGYYLSAAEGGTAVDHSQVVLRSKELTGPYEPYEKNPILTQRHLAPDRPNPITSVGHADLVQDADGNWWATFLGVRPYEGDLYNTGRETFLMPVKWKNGWPVILEGDEEVHYNMDTRPAPLGTIGEHMPMSGNFSLREDFDGASLPFHWMTLRVPKSDWWTLSDSDLTLDARPVALGSGEQPSYLGRRQQHQNAVGTTEIRFSPEKSGDEAGLAILQSDDYFYALGIGLDETGEPELLLRRRAGPDDPVEGTIIDRSPLSVEVGAPVQLRITARQDEYDFAFRHGRDEPWTDIATDLDGTILSTQVAGGFVGATFGLYAEAAPR